MLKKKLEEAMNEQINAEYYSSYLYLSMSAYFDSLNLSGFAHWMRAQSQEELMHALKFFAYVNERGGRVTLKAIEAPETKWASPLKAFEETLKHEEHVTSLINQLMDLAIKENDHASQSFLKWFIDEQVEEEASASAIVEKLKMIKDAPSPLFMMDRELGARGGSDD
jgi:ferritin